MLARMVAGQVPGGSQQKSRLRLLDASSDESETQTISQKQREGWTLSRQRPGGRGERPAVPEPVSTSPGGPAGRRGKEAFPGVSPSGSRPLRGKKRTSNYSLNDCHIPHRGLSSVTMCFYLILLTRSLSPREGICPMPRKRRRQARHRHWGLDVSSLASRTSTPALDPPTGAIEMLPAKPRP